MSISFTIMQRKSVLIVDDDADIISALQVVLEDEFDRIDTESNATRIPALLQANYDAILLDMNFSAGINTGNEGLFWLQTILQQKPDANVVLMTAYGNIDLAVEAIKRGARDFILKPWHNEKLIATLRAVVGGKRGKQNSRPNSPEFFFESRSPVMVSLMEKIARVAPTDASVLLLGENGTGKDVVAHEIHRKSQRASEGFYTVDLATLTPGLFESELFGHKKGSFTDAKSDRKGRFESADGGTLFLDEIGNLPLALQSKLLTVLQRKEVMPVGSNTPVAFNVRIISATNAALDQMVKSGEFRQDLMYRLNTITIEVPALRDRDEDVLPLAEFFLQQYKAEYGKGDLSLSDDAQKSIKSYHWPGNVRELRHSIEKAVILADNVITARDLALSTSARSIPPSTMRTLDDMEKDAIQHALNQYGGNIVQAAKALGITRQTLYNKMKKYGI